MKVVILAGGFGTRISEESVVRPKPLVEIGGRPILWHIMKIYSSFGLNDFVEGAQHPAHRAAAARAAAGSAATFEVGFAVVDPAAPFHPDQQAMKQVQADENADGEEDDFGEGVDGW